MRKWINRVGLVLLVLLFGWGMSLWRDRETLNRQLIRMHVIASSDSREDQQIKLAVRDAVLGSIQGDLENISDVDSAKVYLRENLLRLQTVANETLRELGAAQKAVVTFCKESFPVRVYDTFRLPSGVYDTVKVTIGEGEGKNWWCVTFPTLCLPATSEAFTEKAVGAGFSRNLADTLTGSDHEIRFLILDLLGKYAGSAR